jgi:hypothetical protein
MTAKIDGNGLVAGRQMGHLSVPVAESAAKSVDEDDWRTAFAGDDMVDEWHALVFHIVNEAAQASRQQPARNW